MIRTITRRLLLALAVAALALPLAAAPLASDLDTPPSSLESANPLVQLWNAFQEFLGLDSDTTTTSEPPAGDPEAGPYIDPHGGTEEPAATAGPLIDPIG